MTVKDLRAALASYPDEAVVFVWDAVAETSDEVERVTPSEDSPNEEVYLNVNEGLA